MIRSCGSSWEYCDDSCSDCVKSKIIASDNTNYNYKEVYYYKETTTDGKLKWFGIYSGEHKH